MAIKGCGEILTANDELFDTVAVAVGTGGTYIGLSQSCTAQQQLLGFKAVNDPKVDALIEQQVPKGINTLIDDFIFGGYGKVPDQLVHFINDFYQSHQILLDPTYTGKMLFGIFTLIKNNAWRWGKNVLVIHTGGVQAIEGFNQRQKRKKSSMYSGIRVFLLLGCIFFLGSCSVTKSVRKKTPTTVATPKKQQTKKIVPKVEAEKTLPKRPLTTDEKVHNYLTLFGPIAQREMRDYHKIPA